MNKVRTKKATCRRQKKLLQRRICRQEQALKLASNMIFNNVGQNLSLAKLNLATSRVEQPPQAREKIDCTHDLVSRAITDLRQLGNELNEVIEYYPGIKTTAATHNG